MRHSAAGSAPISKAPSMSHRPPIGSTWSTQWAPESNGGGGSGRAAGSGAKSDVEVIVSYHGPGRETDVDPADRVLPDVDAGHVPSRDVGRMSHTGKRQSAAGKTPKTTTATNMGAQ